MHDVWVHVRTCTHVHCTVAWPLCGCPAGVCQPPESGAVYLKLCSMHEVSLLHWWGREGERDGGKGMKEGREG